MPIVDLVTLAKEMRDLYPTALQVHSPVSQMMLTMLLPFNVATKLNCKLILSHQSHNSRRTILCLTTTAVLL